MSYNVAGLLEAVAPRMCLPSMVAVSRSVVMALLSATG